MPIDARLAPLVAALEARPVPVYSGVAERRAARGSGDASAYAAFVEEEPFVERTGEESIDVTDPPGSIPVRVYDCGRPGGGALVFFHGGGWWTGSPEDSDRRCRAIAARAGIVVFNIGYRLAPEFGFPTPVEDAYRSLVWAVEQAGRYGFDPAKVGVAGDSAGGNLSAAVAILARDRGGPALRLQVLEIPALDLTLSSPSVEAYADGPILPLAELRWCVGNYLGDHDPADPLASPLHAADLSGLPSALIMVAECDPLADDGLRYADRLTADGVRAVCRVGAGHVHGSQTLTALLPSAREWRDTVVAAVREHLA